MSFQYDFAGTSVPINTQLLRCPKCITPLTWQKKLLVIPPDPPPIFNTRPEPLTVDNTNWLVTDDDDIITTESGDPFTTNIPNPGQDAYVSNLSTSIAAPSGSVSVMYLDLFNGAPASGGTSVLALITGSSTRTNIASNLTTDAGVATNTSPIIIETASENNANVTHVGFYSAASGGSLVMSGTVSATYPTIVQSAAVQFDALGISIDLN